MLLSISLALIDYLKNNKVSEEEVTRRTAICGGCEHKKTRWGFQKKFPFIGRKDACNVCKCFLNGAMGKIRAPREHCPLGKWKQQ